MSTLSRPVDLTKVPPVPWAWVDEHVLRRHSRMQRESVAERAPTQHRLSVPPYQWNHDQIQVRGYYGVSGIAAGRRRLGRAG